MSKILIVEDESQINKMIERLLQKNNYDTLSAFSGTEALLLLERGGIDLMLLNLGKLLMSRRQ